VLRFGRTRDPVDPLLADYAVELADGAGEAWAYFDALKETACALALSERQDEVLGIVGLIASPHGRSEALEAIFEPLIAAGHTDDLLDTALELEDDYPRDSTLTGLGVALARAGEIEAAFEAEDGHDRYGGLYAASCNRR
jgi:hypothetical protein